MYLLRLALRPWRQAFFSQVLTGSAAGILLFLSGLLAWVQLGLNPVIERMRHEQVLTVYLDPALEKVGEGEVVDTIRTALGAQAERLSVTGVDEFLQVLKPVYPEIAQELENLGSEKQLVVPRYLSLAGRFTGKEIERIRAVKGVESLESSRERFAPIVGVFEALQKVALVFAAALILALLTGLVHLARLNAHFYSETTHFLRLWGGGWLECYGANWLSGIAVGLLGGGVALSAWLTCGNWLVGRLTFLSPVFESVPALPIRMGWGLLLAGVGLGLFSGLLASFWNTSFAPKKRGAGGRAWI